MLLQEAVPVDGGAFVGIVGELDLDLVSPIRFDQRAWCHC